MQLSVQFKKELNDFQGQIMDDWYNKTSKRIGVSIQIDQQIQNHNESHTRTQPTNSYCQHWVGNEEHVKKCDRLDIELKEELNKKSSRVTTKGLACRCHKGVSNFVQKLELFKTNWYIYYGQFILSPLYASEEVIDSKGRDNYEAISNDIVKLKLNQLGFAYFSPNNNAYIKENPITTKQELVDSYLKGRRNLLNKLDDIAVVDLFDFMAFKDFVEMRFNHFLTTWHNKYDKTNSVIPVYVEENKKPLDVLLTKFESSLEVQKDNKRDGIGNELSDQTIKTLKEIIDLLGKIKSNSKIVFDEKHLKFVNAFAELEDKGIILKKEWLDKSEPVINMLKSIII